jgi:hypothetical protein
MGTCNLNPSVTSAIDSTNGQLHPLPVFIPKKYVPVGLSIKVDPEVVLVVMVRREIPTLLPRLEFHSSSPQFVAVTSRERHGFYKSTYVFVAGVDRFSLS